VKSCIEIAPLIVSRPLGLLEESRTRIVEIHLKGCASCRGLAKDADRALEAASIAVAEPERPDEEPAGFAALCERFDREQGGAPPPRSTPRALWLLGAALVVAAGATAALWQRPAPQAPGPVAAAPPAKPEPPAKPAPPAKPPAPRPAHEIDARIFTIDTPAPDRVEVGLSVGSDDKVLPGMIFVVERNGQPIAELEVVKVRADSCTCRIVSQAPGVTLSAGDAATAH
jgi:hypothetical protein